MLSFDEIQQYLTGAWRMMLGKPDGLRLLDLSADGFWNSFFAMLVALPPLAVSWAGITNQLAQRPELHGGAVSILPRLAAIDFGAWLLPLVLLAFAAPRAGIGDRFVHYVVASNWGSAVIIWMMLPPALLRLVAPGLADVADLVSLLLFGLTLVLSWRLTNAALEKGAAVATAVFVAMFFASLAALFGLQSLLGLAQQTPA